MERRPASLTDRLFQIETVVLVNPHPDRSGYITAPSVAPGNAVRVTGFHTLQQVGAEKVSPIVRFAETLEDTILQQDRLQFGKEQLAHARCVHGRRRGHWTVRMRGDRSFGRLGVIPAPSGSGCHSDGENNDEEPDSRTLHAECANQLEGYTDRGSVHQIPSSLLLP